MITDTDIKKLKKTFATKDDLKRFATKDDLKRFATKDDLQNLSDKIIEVVVEMTGNLDKKLDGLIEKINDHNDILNNHERRIENLEEKSPRQN